VLHLVQRDGYAEVKTLAQELQVDASTIRRDLNALASSGRVERTHGGARRVDVRARAVEQSGEGQLLVRVKATAGAAARRVRQGDTVILDAGRTCFEVAVALNAVEDLTVITNDVNIGHLVAGRPHARLLMTGGELVGGRTALSGEHAVQFIRSYTADWVFLSADGVDATAGITTSASWEVPLKKAMLGAAERRCIVADSTKINRRTLAHFADLSDIDLVITDELMPDSALPSYLGRVIRGALPSSPADLEFEEMTDAGRN
jgi:DeoR/GlpR family transcriptional regulator of sugar metabolism